MELTTTGTKNLRADIRKVPQVERLRWIANFFKLCGPIYLLLKGFSQQETLNLYLSIFVCWWKFKVPSSPHAFFCCIQLALNVSAARWPFPMPCPSLWIYELHSLILHIWVSEERSANVNFFFCPFFKEIIRKFNILKTISWRVWHSLVAPLIEFTPQYFKDMSLRIKLKNLYTQTGLYDNHSQQGLSIQYYTICVTNLYCLDLYKRRVKHMMVYMKELYTQESR